MRFFRVHSREGVDEGGEKLDWGYIALLHFIIVTIPSPPLRCLYGHNNNEYINMNCEAFNQQRFICNIPTLKLYNKNVSFLFFLKQTLMEEIRLLNEAIELERVRREESLIFVIQF